jgi:GPI-anchor transamidase subunit U
MALILMQGGFFARSVCLCTVHRCLLLNDRQSPILLALFSTLIPLTSVVPRIMWSLFDGLAAWCLVQIWRIRSNTRNIVQEGLIVTMCVRFSYAANTIRAQGIFRYLLHPYLLLPTLALSTSTLDNALLMLGLYFAAYGNALRSNSYCCTDP